VVFVFILCAVIVLRSQDKAVYVLTALWSCTQQHTFGVNIKVRDSVSSRVRIMVSSHNNDNNNSISRTKTCEAKFTIKISIKNARCTLKRSTRCIFSSSADMVVHTECYTINVNSRTKL